jgi:hypothetical protein
LTSVFSQTRKDIINNLLVYAVVLFLYIRIVFAWGVLLSPYKTFFTNGVREGDFIHEKFEYDADYEIDKFYR